MENTKRSTKDVCMKACKAIMNPGKSLKKGADIVVVQHPDGTYHSCRWYQPFKHKRKCMRWNSNSAVTLKINNEMLPFTLKLKDFLHRDEKTGVATFEPSEHLLEMICRHLRSDEEVADGKNDIEFILRDHPEASVSADIYYWKWQKNCKLIVTDVDGTITRSDLGGLFGSCIEEPWNHPGIAKTFKHLHDCGYKIIYLTARPISMIDSTRKSIFSSLPHGPVVTTTFGRRRTIKKFFQCIPHSEFKKPCLKQYQELFPKDENPFHAAFGNRKTDVRSYREVGIPLKRIYYIKNGGIETHDQNGKKMSWFKSFPTFNDFLAGFPPIGRSVQNDSDSDSDSAPLLRHRIAS